MPVAGTISFELRQRQQQAQYFATAAPHALMPGWAYRLIDEHRLLNLAPSLRSYAPDYFSANGIQWHRHANHALSSQVCCVNFLMPLASRPDALASLVQAAIGGVRPTMLPVEAGPDGTPAYVGFEWIGGDHLRESSKSGTRSRGANATAADAVVRFERQGKTETLLIEWKYTEHYGAPISPDGNETRTRRYADIAFAPTGPIRHDLGLKLGNFFYEPFYQLLRQQMLAHFMQATREDGADRVRVLHISPSGNIALRKVTSPALRRFGDDVFEVWKGLLVDPTSFVSWSAEALFAPLLAELGMDDDWAGYLSKRYAFLTATNHGGA
ncbi:MAG: hypothetical protein JWQ89_1812 [Devosia sp.]|uniref:PGN_0703 family putative restriction endonuclease n=1 Tax=Devosia sp. TaxID=1871048 RepID=UPI00260F25F8|nr:hypothetical protein [Devosia sp.]MDB5540085.1 hypothetical protein [Devosia sp.]